MSKTKWTAGPYSRNGRSIYALHEVPEHRVPVNRFYAHIDCSGSDASSEELEAVAQLWVAAPAMAEALEELLKWVRPIAGDNRNVEAALIEEETVRKAEAALSLARGETS